MIPTGDIGSVRWVDFSNDIVKVDTAKTNEWNVGEYEFMIDYFWVRAPDLIQQRHVIELKIAD